MTSAEPMLVADGVPPTPGERAPYQPARPVDPFSPFFEAHHAAVSAYLRRRAPADVADELTVTTFEVAWQRWVDVPIDRPLPWLYGVARRQLANQRRSEQRRGRLRTRLAGARHPGGSHPAAGSSSVDPAATAGDALAARQALERLRPDDREALLLVAWEGLDAAAAAASLGISAGAFAVRLHRARERLEELLPSDPTAPT